MRYIEDAFQGMVMDPTMEAFQRSLKKQALLRYERDFEDEKKYAYIERETSKREDETETQP